MGKRELVALLNLSSWCLMMVEWLFLAVPWGCLRFVIVVFPDHTHLLFCLWCLYIINHSVSEVQSLLSPFLISSAESTVFSGKSVCVRFSVSHRVSVLNHCGQ